MAGENEQATEAVEPIADLRTFEVESAIEVREDGGAREVDLRIVPWDVVVDTPQGPEMFVRGAFDGLDPSHVVLRLLHQDPPAGAGRAIDQRDDGAYMTFGVSGTPEGDRLHTLAKDKVTRGASPGFYEVPGGTRIETRQGRRVRVHHRVDLREVSTTWRPTYREAAVMAVRHEVQEEPNVPENGTENTPTTTSIVPAPDNGYDRLAAAFEQMATRSNEANDRLMAQLQALEERQRTDIAIPAPALVERQQPPSGEWLKAALRILTGERVPDLQMRELAELITTDNIGVVPPAYSQEIVGVIDPSRPFMNTTRRLNTPDSGMQLILPRIVTRPTVGIQNAEKDELTSTETAVDTVSFDAVTKGGAGDISIQLLKRSSPSFLTLYLQLLAEAYAIDSEHEALEAMVDLVGDYGGVANGGTLDPEDLSLGSAWEGGFSAMRRPPDTIWLSSAAVAGFIDAKANGTNAPLYSQLQANFTAGGGVGGSISGLRAVHVPALDDQAYDVIVGPSTGFAWAEDGTFTLQVDVPAKAGRDVALVGILWFAPLYPSAFTAYTIAS